VELTIERDDLAILLPQGAFKVPARTQLIAKA
jgi:hypothetical protein